MGKKYLLVEFILVLPKNNLHIENLSEPIHVLPVGIQESISKSYVTSRQPGNQLDN